METDTKDTFFKGIAGCFNNQWFAVYQHLSMVHGNNAGDDLAKRRFSGTILTDQGMDFARVQIEIHGFDSRDAAIFFCDLNYFQEHGWGHLISFISILSNLWLPLLTAINSPRHSKAVVMP
jgi:hypothetical protein